ncbi:MAG: type IV pilus biogenesis/stability protein PilW [Pseudomonadota bacterium]
MRIQACWYLLLLVFCSGCGGGSNSRSGAITSDYEPTKESTNYAEMGKQYLHRGDQETALQRLKKAIELDPRNAEAHNTLAVLYNNLKKPELAEDHYVRSVELEPENPSIQNNYALFLCNNEREEDADIHFRKALDNPLYKNPEVASTNAGLCAMRINKYQRAENYFIQSLKSETLNPSPASQRAITLALFKMAELNYRFSDYRGARSFLARYEDYVKQNQGEDAEIHTPQTLCMNILVERALGDRNKEASYMVLLRGKFADSKQAKTQCASEEI